MQLTCLSKYVSWHANQIKYKSTSSNTFSKVSLLLLLCCFKPFNYVLYFFIYFSMSFAMKTLRTSNLNTIWGCSDYIIQKWLDIFRLYNSKPLRLCGLWRFTQGLDGLWCVWCIFCRLEHCKRFLWLRLLSTIGLYL
jgi:hypothetical protein